MTLLTQAECNIDKMFEITRFTKLGSTSALITKKIEYIFEKNANFEQIFVKSVNFEHLSMVDELTLRLNLSLEGLERFS